MTSEVYLGTLVSVALVLLGAAVGLVHFSERRLDRIEVIMAAQAAEAEPWVCLPDGEPVRLDRLRDRWRG